VFVAWLALLSTVAADRLQNSGWRIDTPYLRRLLAEPSSR